MPTLAAVQVPADLLDYSLNSVTGGIEALATTRVMIRSADKAVAAVAFHATRGKVERTFSGTGSDVDVVVSSANAYVHALNKMISWLGSNATTVLPKKNVDAVAA
mmetsp:Transcript_23066/g.68577  ORF Transcript_23066/g.68577 Transcript_23066/m.68577 type:complete len:105 (-) Transcript_23066:381-695(-)